MTQTYRESRGAGGESLLTPPEISLVVPLFNERPEILQESLKSVADQTFGDFECIVIDESTMPETIAACEAFCSTDARFRHIRPEQRIGLAASLNLGIELARAPFIARFDSDDICLPERLSLQSDFMRNQPDVDVLGGQLEVIDEQGRTLAFRVHPNSHEEIQRQMHFTTPVAHPTVIIRKRVLEAYGAYDPSFRNAEDLDLWLRLSNHGVRFANVPHVLVKYRQQTTLRPARHWRFNLKARVRNFGVSHWPRRCAGICAILIWSIVPRNWQQGITRRLVLSDAQQPLREPQQ
ncbi:MAG: glycosyltransferase [Burkholderiales bacterium]|nr:glycosyltransferase [Burkholderiales bacterium]MBW8892248.1 glycosyltransferase [Burkholderiales bacterium]